ncbi:MAG: 3'-5' exonuclease [Candidatus Cryptobacteroides sp.]|nr:3'-5' exonuclease [Bacteroidales bacterium]MDY2707172.1 3'-5' exonuclease [Candidatus Cryptobacteroides sp.]MCI6314658.1 3'-5' exonuclease [Bacteroidales bacterium]MCI7749402.1 3'-5' exonuclease [Bacteroidales bacterium]MDD6113525.1 3'-5' exonuclease [Bacteroidales bacterium]
MELNLKRPLLFFDIESTGLNIPCDSIVELSFVKIFPDNEQRIKTWRVCPWDYENGCQRPMNPAAEAVNGISDADVRDEKKFYEIADEVIDWLGDSDLAGYNSAKFDLPMLAEELERVRKYKRPELDIDLHSRKMVDVQVIFHKMEPRNLKAAYRFYVGGDFENAHAAEADTLATVEVLKGQLDKYGEEQIHNDVEWLANFTEMQKSVDYAGRIVLNADKEPCISFGKHKGKTCREVYQKEPSYFAWIEQGDFALDTKRQFAKLKEQFDEERLQVGLFALGEKFNTPRR